MTGLFKSIKFIKPETVVSEKDGYMLTLKVHRYAKEFMFCYAQEGDPLGIVTFSGNGVSVKWGNVFKLINLSYKHEDEIRMKIGAMIEQKYHKEVDYGFLQDIFHKAFRELHIDWYTWLDKQRSQSK